MAHFGGGPQQPAEQEDMVLAARNARYGRILFVVYLLFYAAFVALNAYWPNVMERDVHRGINLATAYGFALIFGALLLAMIYGWLCRVSENSNTPLAAGEARR